MKTRSLSLLLLLAALPLGCGSSHEQSDAGVCGTPVSGGGVLQDFQPPCDPGPGGVLITASGEALALGGYAFPPPTADDLAFVDGWELAFTHVILTYDAVTLSENPDKVPTDESQTDAVVAQVDGPWAVDLHQGGPLPGKGGEGEEAVALAALHGKTGGGAFDPTKRYAFGFKTIAATAAARNVNLDAAGLAAYEEMITAGYTALIAGTATWKGGGSCASTIAGYDFAQLPTTVNFKWGFKLPVTSINCQNPDNDPAEPFANEESQRGIAIPENRSAVAQVTFHTDHFFWDNFIHDSELHFDQYAARYAGTGATAASVFEDFVGYGITPSFEDALGNPLPWRSCLSTFTPPVTTGPMTFDTGGIPVNPNGSPTTSFRDFYDAIGYGGSTSGHLNADGLCFTARNYPSPP